jgi:hypothetical protein
MSPRSHYSPRIEPFSNHNPFHFVEGDLIVGAVVKLCGFWTFMIGDLLGLLDGAAVFEVGGDAGGPEGVTTKGLIEE